MIMAKNINETIGAGEGDTQFFIPTDLGDIPLAEESLDELLNQTLGENLALFGDVSSGSSLGSLTESGRATADSEFSLKPVKELIYDKEANDVDVTVLKRKLSMLTAGIKLLHAQIEQKSKQIIDANHGCSSQDFLSRDETDQRSDGGSSAPFVLPAELRASPDAQPAKTEDKENVEDRELDRLRKSHAELKVKMGSLEDQNKKLLQDKKPRPNSGAKTPPPLGPLMKGMRIPGMHGPTSKSARGRIAASAHFDRHLKSPSKGSGRAGQESPCRSASARGPGRPLPWSVSAASTSVEYSPRMSAPGDVNRVTPRPAPADADRDKVRRSSPAAGCSRTDSPITQRPGGSRTDSPILRVRYPAAPTSKSAVKERRARSTTPPRSVPTPSRSDNPHSNSADTRFSIGSAPPSLPPGWRDLCLEAYNVLQAGPMGRLAHRIVLFDCNLPLSFTGSRSSLQGVRLRSTIRWAALGSGSEAEAGEDLVLFTLRSLDASMKQDGCESPQKKRSSRTWKVTDVKVLKSVPMEACHGSCEGIEVSRVGVALLRLAFERLDDISKEFHMAQDAALGVPGAPPTTCPIVVPPAGKPQSSSTDAVTSTGGNTTPKGTLTSASTTPQFPGSPGSPGQYSCKTPPIPLTSASTTPQFPMSPGSPGQHSSIIQSPSIPLACAQQQPRSWTDPGASHTGSVSPRAQWVSSPPPVPNYPAPMVVPAGSSGQLSPIRWSFPH